MHTYNLFISHSWSYSDEYEKLTKLLKDCPYFSYKDYSVPKYDPIHNAGTDKELYEAIKTKMESCSAVLVLAGVYATYSKWITKEVKIAKTEFSVPKKIIAVQPWGAEHTSEFVKDNADETVGWNVDSIVKAIRGY